MLHSVIIPFLYTTNKYVLSLVEYCQHGRVFPKLSRKKITGTNKIGALCFREGYIALHYSHLTINNAPQATQCCVRRSNMMLASALSMQNE